MAKQRPVETILSGPAASVSGAQLLTGLKNAVIVDMGGTTTDTAIIDNGVPEICESGAIVGGFRTHVKAMNIRTEGLGGDSLIQWNKGQFAIGPSRVAPVSWLAGHTDGTEKALELLQRNPGRYRASSRNMQIITLLNQPEKKTWQPEQAQIFELLAERPRTIDELLQRTGSHFVGALGLEPLEQNGNIQRCGLTPTDLLHIENRFCRWNRDAALSMGQLMADICGRDLYAMAAGLLSAVVEQLTLELLKKPLARESGLSELERGPVCRTLIENMLTGGNSDFTVRINLHHPVIGIGAPIHYFLPQAAATLSTKALIPEHADVANAVGAVTSRIFIRRKIDIISTQPDRYQIVGLAGVKNFSDLDDASTYASTALIERVRAIARAAGTSAWEVDIRQEDRSPEIADGSNIFLGRTIYAQIIGPPDLVLEEFKKRGK
jgi:N-methylhydantoinase A/oxoprolinase/acetone carboxylase beta subunit